MKTLGIIAEYNPLHNGHHHHLQISQKKTEASRTVIVMSSTFMQRGEPAICDKWSRAEMAICAGADLVLELPLPFACASADYFARGAVSILAAAGCTHLAFGAEHPDLGQLTTIARYIEKEPPPFNHKLRHFLDKGHSFPRARSLALQKTLDLNPELISNPNNILAVEYIRTIERKSLPLQPVAVPRQGAPYHGTILSGQIASATAIRHHLQKKRGLEKLADFMPESALQILRRELERGNAPVFPGYLGPAVLARLRVAEEQDIANYPEVAPGLDNRLIQKAREASDWSDLLEKAGARCFVRTRLQRILIYLLLDLTRDFQEKIKYPEPPLYFRPLAFNQKGKEILHDLKEKERMPLITRPAWRNRPRVPEIQHLLDLEVRATDLWALQVPNPAWRRGGRDFRTPPLALL